MLWRSIEMKKKTTIFLSLFPLLISCISNKNVRNESLLRKKKLGQEVHKIMPVYYDLKKDKFDYNADDYMCHESFYSEPIHCFSPLILSHEDLSREDFEFYLKDCKSKLNYLYTQSENLDANYMRLVRFEVTDVTTRCPHCVFSPIRKYCNAPKRIEFWFNLLSCK